MNVAVVMVVNHVIRKIMFDDHAEIEWDNPDIMQPEHILDLILNRPKQAHISNHEKIIDVQNDYSDVHALGLKHTNSTVDILCNEPNQDHDVHKSSVPTVRRLRQAITRLAEAQYNFLPSVWCWIIVSAPVLEQMKISLRWVHIDLFLQVNS